MEFTIAMQSAVKGCDATAKPKIMGAAETLNLKLQQSVTNKYNGRVSEADISECSIGRAIK